MSEPRPPRLRAWVFRIAAATVVPTALLLLAEGALRLAGVGHSPRFFVGSDDDPDLVVGNERFGERFFPASIARSPRPIRTGRVAREGHHRIFLMGGSAAMGDPDPAIGMGRMVEVLLEARFPSESFEVVNTAMTAINSHVVVPIARDCGRIGGSAWVIYLGNNEAVGPFGAGSVFGSGTPRALSARLTIAARGTRLGQLMAAAANRSGPTETPKVWEGMAMFVGHELDPVADAGTIARVHANFAANLDRLLDVADHHAVPVVLCTVATNLTGCPPFASMHRADLAETALSEWQSAFDEGAAALAAGDAASALAAFDRASGIDSQFAELVFQRARALQATGQPAGAEFVSARDLDGLRFRADSQINQMIRTAAARNADGGDVVLVDFAEIAAEASPGGLPGDDLLHEHVHLNERGNYLVAKHIADVLAEQLDLAPPESAAWLPLDAVLERLGWTPFHQLQLVERLRQRLATPPFSTQSNHLDRDEALSGTIAGLRSQLSSQAIADALGRLRSAVSSHPRDWALRQQLASLLESGGDLQGAAAEWQQVTELMPHHSTFYHLGRASNRAKNYPAAESALRESLRRRPDSPRALDSLGIALSHLDKPNEANQAFARAAELDPTSAEPLVHWAMVLEANGDRKSALARFQDAAAIAPKSAPIQYQIGRLEIAAGQFAKALPHYQAAAHLDPDNPAAHLNLANLLIQLDRPDQATPALQRTLHLDPHNQLAQQQLDRIKQR